MSGRVAERTKRRTPCAVVLDGRRHNGFVLDFSMSGIFIQTSAKPKQGQRLDVELVLGTKTLPMHVEVARRKAVPPQLLTVAHGGIGVRILSAPEEFYQLIAEMQGNETAEPVDPDLSAPAATLPQFRVRVKQIAGTRTRTMRVHCESQSDAGAQALEELGEGWKILEVEAVGSA